MRHAPRSASDFRGPHGRLQDLEAREFDRDHQDLQIVIGESYSGAIPLQKKAMGCRNPALKPRRCAVATEPRLGCLRNAVAPIQILSQS